MKIRTKIGIIGLGVVGSACKYGFEKLGHIVRIHDIKLDTSIRDVLDTDICYITVPSPEKDDGSCDTSIVEQVIKELVDVGYPTSSVIAIKSTVEPGTTEKLNNTYDHVICFVPEFLRERAAITDFTEEHDICVMGTNSALGVMRIKESHGKYPKQFMQVTPTEAELVKYFNNVHNATLVTLANSFYEVCKRCGANYTKIKEAVVRRGHIADLYLDCNENFRGFGGVCLPKDTRAMAALCKRLGVDVDFFQYLIDENNKYKVTVFDGMRK